MRRTILAGRVISATTREGVPGLTLRALDAADKRAAEVISNEDGGFHLLLKGTPRKIHVVILDNRRTEIFRTHEPISVDPKSQTRTTLELAEEALRPHLASIVALKPKGGRIVPTEKLLSIYDAINAFGNTAKKYYLGGDVRPGITCPFPEFTDHDNLLNDAWGTIQGDSTASANFRNALDVVSLGMDKRRAPRTSIDFFGDARKARARAKRPDDLRHARAKTRRPAHSHGPSMDEALVPFENTAVLMMAANALAKTNRALASKYMNIVFSQLLEFHQVTPIYNTSRQAMLGDKSAQAGMRHMIDIWGEDCGGRPPLPDIRPGRGDWDPRDEPMEPGLEDTLACLYDLLEGRNFVEYHDYTIDSLSPNNGCPGETATLTGNGFGAVMGQIKLSGTLPSEARYVDPNTWTDTQIEFTIPNGATHGPVDLLFPFRRGAVVCGRVTSHRYRDVSDRPTYYVGGLPRIYSVSFTKNDVPFDPQTDTVIPGESVKLIYENTPNAPLHAVDVRESQILFDNGQFQPSRSIDQFNTRFQGFDGPSRSSRALPSTNYDRSTQIRCEIALTNRCGTARASASFIVHIPALVSLTGIEVTQAVQFFRADEHVENAAEQRDDNSVPLISGKQTLVRVYYTSNQVSTFNSGSSFGLAVRLRGFADGGQLSGSPLTPFNANVLAASRDTSIDNQRGKLSATANFLLPGNWLLPTVRQEATSGPLVRLIDAPLTLEANLELRPFEPWVRDSVNDLARTVTASGLVFTEAKSLQCALVRIAYTGTDADVTDAPSLSDCTTVLAQIAEAYPTAELEVFFPADADDRTITFDGDLTAAGDGCGPGWGGLLNILRELAEAHNGDEDAVWTALLHPTIPLVVAGGCGGGAAGTVGVAAFPIDRHTTGMQEIGHGFGRDHPFTDDPNYPDYQQDGNPSVGEFGVRVSDINPNNLTNLDQFVCDPDDFNDFMSPPNGGATPLFGRWVSPYTYMGLMNDFFSTNASSSDVQVSFGEAAQPRYGEQILVSGVIDLNTDAVVLKPLIHGGRRNGRTRGKASAYSIRLVNDHGRVIFETPLLYRFAAADALIVSQQVPLIKQARHLEIVKGERRLLQVTRKEAPPVLEQVVLSRKDGRIHLSWTLGGEDGGYWSSVELTCDGGKTWTRISPVAHMAEFSVDSRRYGGGSKCKLRVAVTDGFNTVYRETEAFGLPIQPPLLVPINFSAKSRFVAGSPYRLKVQPIYTLGVSHRTGITWHVDDELVGRGKHVDVQFKPGQHRIRVMADEYADSSVVVDVSVEDESAGAPPPTSSARP